MKSFFLVTLIFFTIIWANDSSSTHGERLFDMRYVQNVGEDEELIADNMALLDTSASAVNELLDLPVPDFPINENQMSTQQDLLKPEGM